MRSLPVTVVDYQLLHLAGRGAFGSVWVARDRTSVLLAVKVVEPAHLSGQDHGEREEQALALVRQRVPNHPHLVSISHVSRQDGYLIYAMELADPAPGSPPADQDGYQADTLARRILNNGRLSLPDALRITLDLLSALDSLHDAGLVHRDVKPQNVIFVGGVPKLADVGLAAIVQTQMSFAGTAGYVPLDGSTGPDADLYALGKLLYQMVTGREPADFPIVPAEILNGPDARRMRRLNRVLLRACAPTKAARFGSARELRAALASALAPRRVPWRKATLAASVLSLLLACGVGWWMTRPRTQPQPSLDAPPAHSDRSPTSPPPTVDEVLASLSADPVDDAFIQAVATLPAEEQIRVVTAKLQKLNPGFDGKMDIPDQGNLVQLVRDGQVVALSFSCLRVSDISPLRALPRLRELYCGSRVPGQRGQLADLTPLCGLKLTKLWFDWSKVEDLSPLAGMPLTNLGCMGNYIRDLRPCQSMPLQEFYGHSNQIRDLSPLRDCPLRHLNVGANPLDDFKPVRGMALLSLTAFETDLADLSIVADAPLEALFITKTKIVDLSPLRGKALKVLSCADNGIKSLEPLRGQPLEVLAAWNTQVTDISPLAGMKLRVLELQGSPVTDFSALRGMPLWSLRADVDLARDGAVLKSLSQLQSLNGRSIAQVLK